MAAPPPETPLWRASLDGHACDAYAWVQSTRLDVLDGEGHAQTVTGVRRWRGRAFIDRDALPPSGPGAARLRYAGRVESEEGDLDVDAEVFLTYARVGGDDVPARCAYVEFVGAGGPCGGGRPAP
ncbi:MAG: hypothetical protein R3247_07155 [Rhodothermales bacterium]|nr:hypothetical protein [Rhodothermales bacterium]